MKTIQVLFILLTGTVHLFAQSDLYDRSAVNIKTPYGESSGFAKYRYDSLSYEEARQEARHQQDYAFESFKYKSDGIEVSGYSCRPRVTENTKMPVIIYNRGGTGNFGSLSEEDLPDLYAFAKHGFALYASNYRFVGELGALDQLGGDDIQDVVNLYTSIKNLEFVDQQNIFMVGISRGGLMTYKSLKEINVNAAAVLGGIADFHSLTTARPIFLTGWDDLSEELNYKGLENILPNFEQNRMKYLDDRSAVKWANEINTPLYLLHSRQDGRVPVEGVLQLAMQLNKLDKEYQVKIYDRKSHSLPYSKFDSYKEIIHWFKNHMK